MQTSIVLAKIRELLDAGIVRVKLSRNFRVSFKLWWVNGWLRFSGFRIFIVHATEGDPDTRIGLMWWGWPNDTGDQKDDTA